MEADALAEHERQIESALRSPPLRVLFDHWRAARGQRRMPAPADFDPDDIPRIMPYLVVFDVERDPERFRLRSIGDHIKGFMPHDNTGKYLDEIYGTEASARLTGALHRPVEMRAAHRSQQRSYFAEHLKFLNYEGLTLPYASDGAHVDMLITGIQFLLDDPAAERAG